MALIFNRARMDTSTTGTGTITLGSAITGYATFAEAGVANNDVVSYTIEDGSDFEIGIGTYTASGTTLSRDTVTLSKISGTAGTSKISLSGSAQVFITARAEDIAPIVASGSISSAATLDIDLSGGADLYEIDLMNIIPVTDNVQFGIRVSQSSSFLSGASDYTYSRIVNGVQQAATANAMFFSNSDVGNGASEGIYTACFRIYRPSAASFRKAVMMLGGYYRDLSSTSRNMHATGYLAANNDAIDGVQFFFSSGNIASGYYAVRAISFT